LDKKIIGILLIAILATVFIVSYFLFGQPNQAGNTANSPSPEPTPVSSPSEESNESASIPKPSVPEFTLKYVNHSYYEQPTYTIDPYTGEQVIENEGGYIQNDSIEIIIRNQPFTSYRDANGNTIILFYNIRYKGHYGDQWRTYPLSSESGYWEASQSEYTVVSLPNTQVGHFPTGGQMDFQVQALIGYETAITSTQLSPDKPYNIYTFHGTEGSWSNTQTITIP